MGDMNVLDFVKNVGCNVVTGGMYRLVKAGVDTVKTGNPSALYTQGLDIGMASTGNQLAVDLGGEKAGMAFNAAGGALGAAGAAKAFSSLPGFAAESGVAPLAAGAESATPLAPGVLSSTAPADLAATELTGPVGLPAAAGTTPSGGMISATTAPAMQSAPMATLNNSGVPMNMADSMMVGPAGSSNLAQAAKALGTAPTTQGWWASQPDEVKAILMGGGVFAGGGPDAHGGLGGLFEGVSVQQRLELEQLINEQRQNQVQYLNKNQTYAPKLNFRQPTGIIAVGKV